MSERAAGERFEPWAFAAFALLAACGALLVFLGLRPGTSAIRAYLYGPPLLGLVAAVLFAGAVVWSLVKRPVLSRRRVWPFGALMVVVWLASFPLPYPSSHEGHPSSVAFRLPVDGTWRVRWGGDRRETNVLVLSPSRRFGFDLVAAGDAASLGAPVRAPAPGRVVGVRDGWPDGAWLEGGASDPFGNHVVIEVAAQEYLVLAALQQASVLVAAGDAVTTGQPLARVGHSAASGATPKPHLMVHLQDSPVPGRGEGIPMRFHDFFADGVAVAAGVPRGGAGAGQVVRSGVSGGAPGGS